MDHFTERKALQEHIQYLREERRRLGDEIWKAMERIKELDNQQFEATPEITEKLENIVASVERVANKLPTMNAVDMIEQMTVVTNMEHIDTPEEIEQKISQYEIEKSKDDEARKKKRNQRQDLKIVADKVLEFLKEQGRPVKSKQIQVYLNSQGIKLSNMSASLNIMMDYQPKIERAARGFYQAKL